MRESAPFAGERVIDGTGRRDLYARARNGALLQSARGLVGARSSGQCNWADLAGLEFDGWATAIILGAGSIVDRSRFQTETNVAGVIFDRRVERGIHIRAIDLITDR